MQQKKESPLKGKTILIVDDEPDLRAALAFGFKRLGCRVLEAGSGNEGFELASKSAVDLVLSDVRMPNGTGVEFLDKIRKVHPKLPVFLLITGFAELSQAEAAQKGANGLLDKPIDQKKLIALLENLVGAAA